MIPNVNKNSSLMDFILAYFHNHQIPPEIEQLLNRYKLACLKFNQNRISIDEYARVLTAIIPRLQINKICKALINQYQANLNLKMAEKTH